ncbi:MAG TPA: endo-1,4-beta-xylanase [Pyrinomonadaceae bacterium]|jgi:GH35 family endo-1,4-beta-xylanase
MNPNRLSLILLILVLNLSASCRFAATAKDDSSREDAINKSKNETALLQAQANIEKFRKGEAQIKILDANGKTAKQVQLNIKQSSHDFKFGCYLKIDDLPPEKLPGYEKHFAGLFNYAVVGTYWDFIENKRGIEDWSWFEREIALSRKIGARIAAAPILWGTNQAGTPRWLPPQKDELLPILKKRIQSIAAKHANTIEDWEIVNEPLAPKKDIFANRIGRDYLESAFSWAREAAPAERLMLNEYGVFGWVAAHNFNRDKYFALLEDLIEKDAALDVIGIQAHALGEWYEPANVAEQLNRYAALGKPIQITEFSAQTFNYDDRQAALKISGNYQSGIWDAEKQAQFYREFYTISFGNPQVEAIVTWGLDDERAWLPGIGLIDANGNPKPNYKTLDRLINDEWRTNLQVNLTADDAAKFRGFYGSYEVEVVINGKIASKTEFELKKDEKNEWILNL